MKATGGALFRALPGRHAVFTYGVDPVLLIGADTAALASDNWPFVAEDVRSSQCWMVHRIDPPPGWFQALNDIADEDAALRVKPIVSSAAALAVLLLLAGCGSDGGGSSAAPTPSPTPTPTATSTPVRGAVSVSGARLLRDGVAWTPRGFYQIAFEVPPGELANQKAFWTIAQQNYTPAEYTDMKAAGADTVRIQVAQTGVDPNNALFSAAFRDKVIGAVQAARAAGLDVILSMQDEEQTGEPHKTNSLPDAATQRGWQQLLVPALATDTGVLLEIYNEPHIGPQAQIPYPAVDWTSWANAHNQTIAAIRADGSKNVLLAGGLQFAHQLSGSPALTDPLSQIAYAAHIHPLNGDQQVQTEWAGEFGNFAGTAPVIVTEWGIGYYCDADTPPSVLRFLQYLQTLHVGVVASAWDWQSAGFGSARYDFPNGKFSTFVNAAGQQMPCRQAGQTDGYTPGFGIGLTVESLFLNGTPPATLK